VSRNRLASIVQSIAVGVLLECSILSADAPKSDLDPSRPVMIAEISEDEWILRALWSEELERYENAWRIYAMLFDATAKREYLYKEVTNSLFGAKMVAPSLTRLQKWSEAHPEDLIGKRLLIAMHIDQEAFDQAELVSESLLKSSDHDSDMELAANSYLFAGEYQRGIDLLLSLYAKTLDEETLLRIAALMTQYLNQPLKAAQLLETHRRMQSSSLALYKMLIDLYVRLEKLESILEVYEALYELEPREEFLKKIVEIYLFKRDFDGLIVYLELHRPHDMFLYELYKKESHFLKAQKLAETFHAKDQDPKWLAEQAILIYEGAEDKASPEMLDRMTGLFEDALTKGVDDSVYLNYYGYTLIENEIDVHKGIRIVQRALEQQPKNSFYLDSLAWGYYKIGECLKAYTLMQQVVDQEGLEEPEIKEHWEHIQQCQKSVILGHNDRVNASKSSQ
jgi:hypothetical protein